MKKILFISSILGGGGAERVMTYVMNYLARNNKYKVVLLLISDKEHNYLQNVAEEVKVVKLNFKGRIRYSFIQLYKGIKKINPNIVYISLDSLNLAFSFLIPFLRKNTRKFIARETNVLSVRFKSKKIILKPLYHLFYNLYDAVIAQSDDMKKDLSENFKIKPNKIHKINNPVDIDNIKLLAEQENVLLKKDNFNLIAVGRLNHQKGYDILLKRLFENKKLNFHLTILGKGELEKELKDLILKYGLADRIDLIGFTPNPYKYIKASDAIVLSSRHEGFPNVLLEANSLGKPIIANSCLGGINEIIVEGKNGVAFNFEDSSLFKERFDKFINIKFDCNKIVALTEQRYAMEVIMPQFEFAFNTLK